MLEILLIDDNEDLRWIYSAMLGNTFKAKVMTVSSGNKAIEILSKNQVFDLIISDYNMSDGNGNDLMNFMTQKELGIPLILFTHENQPFINQRPSRFLGIIDKAKTSDLLSIINEFIIHFSDKDSL